MNDIRMIAMDMDGTLLNSKGVISPETASTLRAAQDKGILTAVCSGRYAQAVHLMLEDAGLRMPIIGMNGCMLWMPEDERGRMLAEHFMRPEATLAVFEALRRRSLLFHLFGSRLVVSSDETQFHYSKVQYGDELIRRFCIRFDHGMLAAQKAAQENIYKYFVYGFRDQADREETRALMAAIPDIYVTASGRNNLEIMPAGVDKCSGCEEMARLHGIGLEQVMTFGDFDNDIPMLSRAGFGVAMGNGSEQAKACARYVTDTNDQNGVAKAVARFAL